MFVDRITVRCKAGDGGNGCLSFRRESHVPRGGPDGGDGGRGGNIIVHAERNVSSLANLVGHKHWVADRGSHGSGNLKSGRGGKDVIIPVTPGTLVLDTDRGHLLKDLQDGDSVIVAKGGRGGRGNKHFATATNRTPREWEPGELGEERQITLELKLIADVGLIGKPNAGKSTLLSRLSRAHPEIADYPFTTKYPNLGMVRVGFDSQFVLADIPGLIEGAHAGVGLGHEFLKHVERTRVLVHLVEPSPADLSDAVENYRNIREEMRLYDATLMDHPEIVVVTKSELPDASAALELLHEELDVPLLTISSVTGQGLPELTRKIVETLVELDEAEVAS
ncbi:MAG: GTPase ObgE [Planctomycetaceae bacterium]|nr:GTPase ObgE [Planctomycetaceae bacterium]